MIGRKKVIVVLPAYNAEKTLERTWAEIPREVVDDVLLVDDSSRDKTVQLAEKLGIPVYRHLSNLGYGGNQKTCYQAALDRGADIVVMLHPDYQYPPRLVPTLAALVESGMFHLALGSRILGTGAIRRGMPWLKYVSNRFATFVQNLLLGQKFSEYHTGYRAFSREFLLNVPLLENSDDFVFDNQLLVQAIHFDYAIGEVSTPARYFPEASSISTWRGLIYGLQVFGVTIQCLLQRWGLARFAIFDPAGRKLKEKKA